MAPYTPPPPPPPPEAPNNQVASSLTVGFFGVVVLLCLLCFLYFLRSKAGKKRIEERNDTFFPVSGVIRPELVGTKLSSAPPPFSRVGMTPSIVMPQKSITRKPYHHGLSDKAVVWSRCEPSPAYSTLSFQHPSSNASSRPRTMSILNPARSRHSRSSSGFSTYTPNSPPPGLVRLSSVSTVFPSQPRPVHQLFEPALPDELALTRYGEGLVVLQSFDDGWCLVARDTSRSFRASYLSTNNGDKVDIGLVPAWVFVERLEGNTVTRPFRSTSVNALQRVQKPPDARNAVISWSYFG